jgi:hypothetical protein
MRTWTRAGLALALSFTTAVSAWAQPALPGAPPALPGAAPPPVLGAPVAAPAAAPPNIWSMLCPSAAQKASCKLAFCASPLGQMASAAGAPLAAMSGGLLGNCCPLNVPSAAALAQPAESSGGAAARIKQDELEAKARRAALRYLGTVDCRYWPEAKAALINGLRADKNECCRWEAALALQHGCCCNPEIVLALTICVAGATTDGQPAERSDRVRDAAAVALSMCVIETPAVVAPIEIKEKMPLEIPRELPGTTSKQNYPNLTAHQRAQIVDYARRVLAEYYRRPLAQIAPGTQPRAGRPASNGLFGVVAQAVNGPTTGLVQEPALAKTTPAEPEHSGLLYMAYNLFRAPVTGSPSMTNDPSRPDLYSTSLPGATPAAAPGSSVTTTRTLTTGHVE